MHREERIAAYILILCLVAMFMGVYLIMTQPGRLKAGLPRGIDLIRQKRIAVVHLYGPIQISDGRGFFFLRGSDWVVRKLKRIKRDPRVKGVVLRINSPGGAVGAAQEIYEAIKDLRSSGRPVVVSMGDIATSGAYYVACGADKIVANPGTLTGSIGVIISIPNVKELLGKFGIKFTVIKSGEYKDIGSAFRDIPIEERRLLEGVVNSAYEQFFKALLESRGKVIPYERLRQLADGRIFTGQQAKEVGLIDELGTFEKSISLAAELAGIKDEPLVVEEELFPFESLFGLIEEKFNRDPLNKFQELQGLRLEYRYLPGVRID